MADTDEIFDPFKVVQSTNEQAIGIEESPANKISARQASADQFQDQVQDYDDEVSKLRGERDAATTAPREAQMSSLSSLDQAISQPRPQGQQLPQPPNFQQMQQQFAQNANGIMIAMSALAMFGARRAGPTAALTAFGAMMQGFADGNKEATKQAYDAYKAETQNVLQANKQMQDEYERVINDKKMDFDHKTEMLKLTASKWDDQIAQQLLAKKDFVTFDALLIKRELAEKQLEQKDQAIEKMRQQVAQKNDGALTVDQAIGRVERSLAAGTNPLTGLARSQQNQKTMEDAFAAVAEKHGWTQEELGEHQRLAIARGKALGANYTQESRISTAAHELEAFIPATKDAIAQLNRSQLSLWNAAMMRFENLTNDPKLARANVLIYETVNAASVVGNRGGQTTVHIQQRTDALVNSMQSHEAANAALDALQMTVRIALSAPAQARRDMLRPDRPNEQPYQPPQQQQPPAPDAKQAPDGKWYVQRNGKFYEWKPDQPQVPQPRAAGGPVQPHTPYLVGEQGPEVVMFGDRPGQGQVIPNHQIGQFAHAIPAATGAGAPSAASAIHNVELGDTSQRTAGLQQDGGDIFTPLNQVGMDLFDTQLAGSAASEIGVPVLNDNTGQQPVDHYDTVINSLS